MPELPFQTGQLAALHDCENIGPIDVLGRQSFVGISAQSGAISLDAGHLAGKGCGSGASLARFAAYEENIDHVSKSLWSGESPKTDLFHLVFVGMAEQHNSRTRPSLIRSATLRALAEAIIAAQEAEIAFLRDWLAANAE